MEATQIQPLGDRVLVKTLIDEETRGGVIIPEFISEGRPERARVLAVGPGGRDPKNPSERIPLDFAVGDTVIFHRHAGIHIGGLDDSFIVFREQDILAKIDEDA